MNIPSTPFNLRFLNGGQARIASCMHAEQIYSNIAGSYRFLLATCAASSLSSGDLVRLLSKRGDTLDAKVSDIRRTVGGAVFLEIVAVIPEFWFAPHVVTAE